MVNYNNAQKWLLIIVVIVGILAINYLWYLSPRASALLDQKNTYKQGVQTLSDLQNKAGKKQDIEKEKKFYKYKLVDISQKLPNYIAQEKFVVSLKEIALRNKIQIDKLTFTNPEVYQPEGVTRSYDPASAVSKRADKVIAGLFAKDIVDGVKAQANELQFSNINDESPVKVTVKFAFLGSFEQIKNMIIELENGEYRNVISDITIESKGKDEKAKKGEIGGRATICLYGFKDSKIPVYDLWTAEFERGKGDIFSDASSKPTNVHNLNASDFNIILNAETMDAPSVIVGKAGKTGTEIFGDNKGIENVELWVTESGGKYTYKYKTQSANYPLNNQGESFTPNTQNDIVVQVFSKPRLSDSDNSGINLTVYNKTKRNIQVVPIADDKERPRLSNVFFK